MTQPKIAQGSLLYHAVHGLCCVKQLIQRKESGKDALFYSLEPSSANKMKVRFIIPSASMETSGFHMLVSTAEANGILKYLGGGVSTLAEESDHEASCLAKEILSFSHEDKAVKDQRNRHRMERSINGLVGELAVVLKINLKEAVRLIRKSLGDVSKINPLVIAALENVSKS